MNPRDTRIERTAIRTALSARDWPRAERLARDALEQLPDDARLHHWLAVAVWQGGRSDEALGHFERALALRPGDARALSDCSIMLAGRIVAPGMRGTTPPAAGAPPSRAVALCRLAVRANPGEAALINNQGMVESAEGLLEASLASFDAALRLDPGLGAVRYNRSFVRMRLGDFRGASEDYEFRPGLDDHLQAVGTTRTLPPRWRGQALTGKTLLVHAEQGFGDTIQHLRFLPSLAGLGAARIVLHVQPELLPIADSVRPFAQILPIGHRVEGCDFRIALMSLPYRLGADWHTLPMYQRYLFPRGDRVGFWRERLARAGVPRRDGPRDFLVGLVWQGSPDNARDHQRSLRLSELQPLALPGIRFVSLQTGPAARAARENAVLRPIPLGEELGDFADTAALISQLDLVVTVDTAVAHLSAALGHPTWMLEAHADARWLQDRADSPWYPALRLFRQQTPAHWKAPVMALAYELQQRLRVWALPTAPRPAAPDAGADAVAHCLADCARAPTDARALLALARALATATRQFESYCAYRHALALDERLPDAHLEVGRLLRGLGLAEEALIHHQASLALAPGDPDVQAEFAETLFAARDPIAALRWSATALAAAPALPQARARLQTCLALLASRLPVLEPLLAAWQAQPDGPRTRMLADALASVGVPAAACGLYHLAMAQGIDDAEALRALSDCLLDIGDWPAVVALGETTAGRFPGDVDLRCDQATALWRLGRLEAAEALFTGLLTRAPDHLIGLIHGSSAALANGDAARAGGRAERALALSPGHAEARLALAAVHEYLGKTTAALAALDAILRDVPDHPAARAPRGMLHLRTGDWARGWQDYEARPDVRVERRWLGPAAADARRWQGEPLQGRHLVVLSEQGLGDTLQFLRFLPGLGRPGLARLTLVVQDELAPWLAQDLVIEGIGTIEVWRRRVWPLPAFDYYCALPSLPLLLQVRPDTLPPPWLPPVDAPRRAHWRAWLAERARPAVAACWAGNPEFLRDRERSPGLPTVAPLFEIRGPQWISAQFGPAGRAAEPLGVRIPELGPARGFLDTAALLSECALVVTSDTSVAHLAAGLGRPTWILLPFAADWRWGSEAQSTSWYPGARLFRQAAPGDWSGVIERVVAALGEGF